MDLEKEVSKFYNNGFTMCKDEVIEIAKEYAREMCKEQTQINYEALLSEMREQISLYGKIPNKFLYKVQIDEYFAKAPLPKEIEK